MLTHRHEAQVRKLLYLCAVLREIKYLIAKDLKLELRRSHVVGGLALYILSTVFVCYLGFTEIPNHQTWNALLWIIMLFAAFNAIGRSFDGEGGGMRLYYYTLVSPQGLIIAKILYNFIIMTLLCVIGLLSFIIMLGTEAIDDADLLQFITGFGLGSLAFASGLTLISGIAAKTNNSVGLMALLGFPVIIPTLLILMDFSLLALTGASWSDNFQNLFLLAMMNVLVLGLSFILFPYLWRD